LKKYEIYIELLDNSALSTTRVEAREVPGQQRNKSRGRKIFSIKQFTQLAQ